MKKRKKHTFHVTLSFGASTTGTKDACNTLEQKKERKKKKFHVPLSFGPALQVSKLQQEQETYSSRH